METCDCQMCRVERESSYRTYEEWKLQLPQHSPEHDNRSYRTYEEWKLAYSITVDDQLSGSYRTYEEWKQWQLIENIYANLSFLPYLWGMETR